MPAGTYRYPVQFVTSTEGIESGQRTWVIAGSDGTVHFVGEAGHAIDHFATGHHIRGLAVVGHGRMSAAGQFGWPSQLVAAFGEPLDSERGRRTTEP